jgi:hypothetical protein
MLLDRVLWQGSLVEFKAERDRRHATTDQQLVRTVVIMIASGFIGWLTISTLYSVPLGQVVGFMLVVFGKNVFAINRDHFDIDTELHKPGRAAACIRCSIMVVMLLNSLTTGMYNTFGSASGYGYYVAAFLLMIQLCAVPCLRGRSLEQTPHIFRFSRVVHYHYFFICWFSLSTCYLGLAFKEGKQAFNSEPAMWMIVAMSIATLLVVPPMLVLVYRWRARVSHNGSPLTYTLWMAVSVQGAMRVIGALAIRTSMSSHGNLTLGSCLVITAFLRLWKFDQWSIYVKSILRFRERVSNGAFIASFMGSKPAQVLLEKAQHRLRRVPWQNLTVEVLSSSAGSNEEMLALSEPCEIGSIDFFISHSWSDDPIQKVRALTELGAAFYAQHGRMPYAWLDKLCINQESISEDLECLPVFEMSCTNLLVLCGPTYATRLWCVWELYVFISMTHDEAGQNLTLVTLGNQDNLLDALLEFGIEHAHCTSSSDESAIRALIGTDPSM